MALNYQLPNLPPEIIFDIVSRLPIKPIYRFKSVSKPWLAFINDLIKDGLRNKPLKVVIASNTYPTSFYTLDSHSPNDQVEIKKYSENCFQIIGSCNGILLLRSDCSLFLWNPLTRKQRLIPSPCNYMHTIIEGLSYDSDCKDLKVVMASTQSSIPHRANAYIFSSVSSSWKRIDDFGYEYSDAPGAVINGSPHWIVGRFGSPYAIVYFNPRDDTFGELPIPFIGWIHSHFKLTVLGGNLCAVNDDNVNDAIDVWVVKESFWSKLFVVPRRQGEFCARMLLPVCFVGKDDLDGEEVVIQLDSHALALYNLRKNRFERIELPSNCESFTVACYVETLASP